jgi:FAD/FMN-containing dehydrogenase
MLARLLLATALAAAPAAGVTARRPLQRVRDASNAALFARLPPPEPSAVARARAASAALAASAAPRCLPGEACWPVPAAWAALNASVGGRLVLPLMPEGAVCVDPSSPACAVVEQSWTDPVWRSDQPGAMQRPNWEADQASGANCFTLGAPCLQGNVPPVGVAAASAADVAAALLFASTHNIRVAVKASGHEIQGRSTAAGALLVWLRGLKGFAVQPAFAACPGDAPGPAVSAGPGDSYGDLYAALDPLYTVVGGSARTVSAAGGHLLSGGHSFASPHYGLAADNLLQVEAVLANGTIVRASECENSDLFWALRGGGGGSFAVVTRATHRVHPTPPTGVAGVVLEVLLLQGLASVRLWTEGALALSPALTNVSANAGRGLFGGYFNVEPVATNTYLFAAFWGFNGTTTDAQASLAGFLALAASEPAHFQVYNFSVVQYASFEQWHSSFDPVATGDRTGQPSTIGCRFVPLAAALDPQLRENASLALTEVAQYAPLLGHLVVGGAVAQFDRNSSRTSVTPAWRDAVWHMCLGAGWDMNATIAAQQEVFAGVSSLTSGWRAAFPNPQSGAYFSESDFLEPDWQASLFGAANYARLQSIKATVDPQGVFSCWHCVELPGSVIV